MIDGISFGMNTDDGNKSVNKAISIYLELFKTNKCLADAFLHKELTNISLEHPEVADYEVRESIALLTGPLDFLMDDSDDEIVFFDDDECFGDDLDDVEGGDMLEGGC